MGLIHHSRFGISLPYWRDKNRGSFWYLQWGSERWGAVYCTAKLIGPVALRRPANCVSRLSRQYSTYNCLYSNKAFFFWTARWKTRSHFRGHTIGLLGIDRQSSAVSPHTEKFNKQSDRPVLLNSFLPGLTWSLGLLMWVQLSSHLCPKHFCASS